MQKKSKYTEGESIISVDVFILLPVFLLALQRRLLNVSCTPVKKIELQDKKSWMQETFVSQFA